MKPIHVPRVIRLFRVREFAFLQAIAYRIVIYDIRLCSAIPLKPARHR
ncbi:hypothetical protein SPLC1_S520740 [Arthrospira platensis C1]|nr:hypothetical protein SPLC1_S520740 [Arthrospira platensis C1]